MIKIRYIEFDGTERLVEAQEGVSVMRTALDNGVSGIDADCGGQCACATCHVIVDPAWFDKLPPMSDMEESMLGINPDRTPTSRLSCQIPVTVDLDTLVVRLPEFQG